MLVVEQMETFPSVSMAWPQNVVAVLSTTDTGVLQFPLESITAVAATCPVQLELVYSLTVSGLTDAAWFAFSAPRVPLITGELLELGDVGDCAKCHQTKELLEFWLRCICEDTTFA